MSESENKRDGSRWTLDRKSLELDVRRELEMPSRRLFNRRVLTLGGLTMLTGCTLKDDASVNTFLETVSRMNDRVQAWLVRGERLAPTYTEADITRPFPFNAYYGIDDVPHVVGRRPAGCSTPAPSWDR